MHNAYVKGLVSRIYKGFLEFNIETINNPIKMGRWA